jgi:hypothetical protein
VSLIVRKLCLYVKEREHLLDQGVGDRIELELNFKKCNWGGGEQFGQDFSFSELGPLALCCEHDNKIPFFTNVVHLRNMFSAV